MGQCDQMYMRCDRVAAIGYALPIDKLLASFRPWKRPQPAARLQPDLIIVDAESEARDVLEHVVMATRDERRPIVMFTNDEATSHVKDAVAAGVSADNVAGHGH